MLLNDHVTSMFKLDLSIDIHIRSLHTEIYRYHNWQPREEKMKSMISFCATKRKRKKEERKSIEKRMKNKKEITAKPDVSIFVLVVPEAMDHS